MIYEFRVSFLWFLINFQQQSPMSHSTYEVFKFQVCFFSSFQVQRIANFLELI